MKSAPPRLHDRQLRHGFDRGRYSRVSRRIWTDRWFRDLPPTAKTLYFYLLVNPHLTPIPGLFPVRASTIVEEMVLPAVAPAPGLGEPLPQGLPEGFWEGLPPGFPEALRGPFAHLSAAGQVEADWSAGVVWLPHAVQDDPPANPNVVLGWKEVVPNVPESPLVVRALRGIRVRLQEVLSRPEAYLAAFDSIFPPGFLEGLGEGFPPGSAEGFPSGWGESRSKNQDPRSKIQEGEPAPDGAAVSPEPPTRLGLVVELARPRDLDAEVYAHWRALYAPRANEVLDAERRKLIARRRAERARDTAGKPRDSAQVQQELLDSLSGWKHDPWVERPRNTKLDQLFGDAGKVDQGLKFFADGPPKPVLDARRLRQPGGYATAAEIAAQDFSLPPDAFAAPEERP